MDDMIEECCSIGITASLLYRPVPRSLACSRSIRFHLSPIVLPSALRVPGSKLPDVNKCLLSRSVSAPKSVKARPTSAAQLLPAQPSEEASRAPFRELVGEPRGRNASKRWHLREIHQREALERSEWSANRRSRPP